MNLDADELMKEIDLRIADLLVVGYELILIAKIIFRSLDFVQARVSQPGFAEIVSTQHAILKQRTLDGLPPETNKLGIPLDAELDKLTGILKNGTTGQRIAAATTILALNLEHAKKIFRYGQKKRASTSSKRRRERDGDDLGDGFRMPRLNLSGRKGTRKSATDPALEVISRSEMTTLPLPVEIMPPVDAALEVISRSEMTTLRLPVENMPPVDPALEVISRSEMTTLREPTAESVFAEIAAHFKNPPVTPAGLASAKRALSRMDLLSLEDMEIVNSRICALEQEMRAGEWIWLESG